MFVIAIDQGTSSSRSIAYSGDGKEVFSSQKEVPVTFPDDGWVEQRPEDIWESVWSTLQEVVTKVGAKNVSAIGITNQRETTIVWDKVSGKPLAPAIVWQCRRSASICERLKSEGHEARIRKKTGLVVDAYFSLSKILWLLEHTPKLSEKVASEDAVFGTVDSWVLYNLTAMSGKPVFKTEASNASRTMLYSLADRNWDEDLLKLAGITKANLCDVAPSFGEFGRVSIDNIEIPVTCMLGDQQSSLFGNGCVAKGSAKCTFGTGAFLLMNCGADPVEAPPGILTTAAWSEGDGSHTYALEGAIFIAGSLIQWLRDKLGIIGSSEEVESLAQSVATSGGVILVPAFVGLGAPYWDASARGALFGLTRDSSSAHIARAALEAVSHQTADLLDDQAFSALSMLAIDGGMSLNRLFCQLLSDLTNREVLPAKQPEMTAFGAGRGALYGVGHFSSLEKASEKFIAGAGQSVNSFNPSLDASTLGAKRALWTKAVERVRGWK